MATVRWNVTMDEELYAGSRPSSADAHQRFHHDRSGSSAARPQPWMRRTGMEPRSVASWDGGRVQATETEFAQ